MNRFILAALGGFALATTAPLAAQTLAPGEIELHIEAIGQVAPDTAFVPINLVGTGKDDKAAAADLKRKEAELLAGLAKLGIDRSKAVFASDDEPRYAEVIAATEMPCADSPVLMAESAAPSIPPAPQVSPITTEAGCKPQDARSPRMVIITVEDLTKLQAVTELGSADDYYSTAQMNLYTRDPAAAKAKAVSAAIAQARTEAETYAAAMGYRVVRIMRVSNAKPSLNLPDIMGLIGGMAMRGRSEREEMRAMVGATMAGAAIDFVIAPK